MWTQLGSFPDYEIHEAGAVRRLKSGRPVATPINQQGNPYVGLSRDGLQVKRSLALLVAIQFLDRPPNSKFDTPIHLDGDKRNCAADNLMWRPRHFAIKYHQQFWNGRRGFLVPIYEVNTGETFPTSWEAALKYGLIDREILTAAINRTVVFPTGQHFRPVDDFTE